MFTYKIKNHKYKTIHKYLIYNFINTQDQVTFMDNLVKFLLTRKFSNIMKLQIFELMKRKRKDKFSIFIHMLNENLKRILSPKSKVYCKKRNFLIVTSF